ncbi:MAG: AEC family transporter [Syntrophorhabdus sp.]
MDILITISPIFIIIAFGYFLKARHIISERFITETNRFVFRYPLPFLIFIGIVKSGTHGTPWLALASVTLPAFAVLAAGVIYARLAGYKGGKLGSFVQSTFHGNVTYVGLAVIFYLLGESGLEKGSLLIGTLILFNNALAIIILSLAGKRRHDPFKTTVSIITTPIIIATAAGIACSWFGIPIPAVIMKSLEIVANVALPLALIIIGGSISFTMLKSTFFPSLVIMLLKEFALPGLALGFYTFFSGKIEDAIPAILLLATPTAITTYIMAREMKGDSQLTSGAITMTTLVSPAVYLFWMHVLKP